MRWWNRIYLTVFGCILLSLSGLILIMPAKAFSDEENRYLAQFPEFSWSNMQSGDFGKELEQYVADQVPLREYWVNLKAWVEVGMNKKENNEVYAGKDGYLLQKLPSSPSISLNTQLTSINHFAENINIPLHLMLVPNSAAIQAEKLPRYAPVPDQKSYMELAYTLLDEAAHAVDSYEALLEHKDEYIYYRTDHHWTTLGAYYAYQVYAEQVGLTPFDKTEFQIDRISDRFYGTLTAKSKFRHVKPDSIDIWIPKTSYKQQVTHMDDGRVMNSLYDWDKLRNRDQYPVFLGGNHALTVIETPDAPDQTLLVIKDSYAHSMVPFLSLHYKNIHLVDLRYLNMSMKEYASMIEADEVLILYNIASFQSDTNLVKLSW